MARTKGASRRVISWTSIPAPVKRPGFSRSYDHTLLLDCGHTVVRRFPEKAQFKFSDCPNPDCEGKVVENPVETVEKPITDTDRLRWLQEQLMTANNGIFWFHVQHTLGFEDDEFTAPGDVTMGECFNAAIDKRIREGK